MPPLVGLVLGKPPERSPVIPEVLRRLASNGAATRVPGRDQDLPPWLEDADVLPLRGLRAPVLAALTALEKAGVRCCNAPCATAQVLDRQVMLALLRGGDVPCRARPAWTNGARRAPPVPAGPVWW